MYIWCVHRKSIWFLNFSLKRITGNFWQTVSFTESVKGWENYLHQIGFSVYTIRYAVCRCECVDVSKELFKRKFITRSGVVLVWRNLILWTFIFCNCPIIFLIPGHKSIFLAKQTCLQKLSTYHSPLNSMAKGELKKTENT